MYKPLTQNIQDRCLVWYFDPRKIPGSSCKLTSFWAGPYHVMKLIALALAKIQPVYYPREDRLVSLDVLDLYREEDVIHQNLEDIDPNRWLDEGELTELPRIHITKIKERVEIKADTLEIPEVAIEPYCEILMLPADPETVAARERIHERIQAEMLYEDKEVEIMAEELLEALPAWGDVPDLMMETKEEVMIPGAATKGKRYEEACGRREDEIFPEKQEGSLRFRAGLIIQQDFILRIGINLDMRRMIAKYQISGREFVADI